MTAFWRKKSGGFTNAQIDIIPQAQSGGAVSYNYLPFLRFMMKVLEESLHDIDYYLKKYRASLELTEAEIAVLDCFREEPEKKLSPKIIESNVEIHRRTVSKILLKLRNENFIQKSGRAPKVFYRLVF